jgi:luciferase family oxidoreductase group 1
VDQLATPDGVTPGLLRHRVNFGAGWSSPVFGFGVDGHYFHSRMLPTYEWSAQGARELPAQWQFDAYLQSDVARWLPWKNDRFGLRAQFRVNNFLAAQPLRQASALTGVGLDALWAALTPGRIDLGVGRAPGSDQRTAYALQRDRSRRMPVDDFPNNLAETIAYLDGTMPSDHPFAGLQDTLPAGGGAPEVWLLGSSQDSAIWAAEAGLPYCIADFINSDAVPLAQLYRQRFRPGRIGAPHLMVATWTIAAPTTAEAEYLALPAQMMFAHLLQGKLIPVPTVARAQAWAKTQPSTPVRRRRALGSPGEVRTQLDQLASLFGADELMLVNILPDHAARVRSYALIAAEYGLARLAKAA